MYGSHISLSQESQTNINFMVVTLSTLSLKTQGCYKVYYARETSNVNTVYWLDGNFQQSYNWSYNHIVLLYCDTNMKCKHYSVWQKTHFSVTPLLTIFLRLEWTWSEQHYFTINLSLQWFWQALLTKKKLLNGIKKMSSDDQTSCLEGFYAILYYLHPKSFCYFWLG